MNMKHFFATFTIAAICAATSYAQTIKSLGYNATNGKVVYTGTNTLNFTNATALANGAAIFFTNTSEFQTPIWFGDRSEGINVFEFEISGDEAIARTNLGLGSTDNVAFRNITSGGNIVISNQTATNNGILFIYRTNNEPFLGLANLIASNNTTISNETLFRVGVAEATNKSAQFGFRSTNTNGTGVAVFSVFGYNALAMVGPSSRSATNTNGIEADIYSISPTNKVATLIDTNTGATLMHRPVGFNTNASAPANTTNVAGWIQFYVGTNSVRVPYYQ
jgi:hypothetical protein